VSYGLTRSSPPTLVRFEGDVLLTVSMLIGYGLSYESPRMDGALLCRRLRLKRFDRVHRGELQLSERNNLQLHAELLWRGELLSRLHQLHRL
jgi:hypothetical protein